MQNRKTILTDLFYLAAGELLISAATIAVFLLLNAFSYKVITGVALGSAVAIFNFTLLSVSVNRAVDKFMALRGDGEMTEEEADDFAAKHSGEIQNAQKVSYLIRTLTMLGSLVLAFLSEQFDVIATVIPLLCFQPVLIFSQQIKLKRGNKN